MGFFDVFRSRKKQASPTPSEQAAPTPQAKPQLLPPEQVPARMEDARKALEKGNTESAVRAFEQILSVNTTAEVLAEISSLLGQAGLIDKLVTLIEPLYDLKKHGPLAGINLLQAHLVMADSTRAGHILGLLRGVEEPEVKNRVAELEQLYQELLKAESGQRDGSKAEAVRISMVSISKPIWFYGLEPMAEALLPTKAPQTRRLAFAQLAILDQPGLGAMMLQPEEELGRLCRALPLWFAETLFFSTNYQTFTALGVYEDSHRGSHYALFGTEWTVDNIRQLVESSNEPIDYLLTGAIKRQDLETELTLRLWDVRKLKERKIFTTKWTPSTMDAELSRFHELLRTYMEFLPYPAGQGLPYTPAPVPSAWLDTLGASVSLFLAEKQVIHASRVGTAAQDVEKAAARAAAGTTASLAWITMRQRARKLGFKLTPLQPVLASSPVVTKALDSAG